MKIIFSISFLVIALSVAYYFVWFLPNKEKTNQQLQVALQAEKLAEDQIKQKTLSHCALEAQTAATELLKTKSKLPYGDSYKEMVAQGMYLTADYDNDYKRCLQLNGLSN